MVKRAALILAGGKAQRFQMENQSWKDKALAELNGKPLLIYAVENVLGIVDEVVVCVNGEERKSAYATLLGLYDLDAVRIVVDEKFYNISGPIVAILSGLNAVQADVYLTVPCDAPFINPKVASYLMEHVTESMMVVPMWPNGTLETLTMALPAKIGNRILQTLCLLNRPRTDDIMRGAQNILLVSPLGEIRKLDPELKSFVNINSQEDLKHLPTRTSCGNNALDINLSLNSPLAMAELIKMQVAADLICHDRLKEASTKLQLCANNLEKEKAYFWAGLCFETQGDIIFKLSTQVGPPDNIRLCSYSNVIFMRAATNYGLEAKIHAAKGSQLLAERALNDEAWCKKKARGKPMCDERYPAKTVDSCSKRPSNF